MQLARKLFFVLESMFPVLNREASVFTRLHEQVIKPAAALAVQIQTSPAQYKLHPDLSDAEVSHQNVVSVGSIRRRRLIDVRSGQTIKDEESVIVDKDGRIGELIMTVAPGLVRHDPAIRKPIRIRNVVWLVELDKPLIKRRKATAKLLKG